jgi:AGCS family alanine or glycine:cation symporter
MDFLLILENYAEVISNFIWGWPIVFFIIMAGIILSFSFSFVQFSDFFNGWKILFEKKEKIGQKELSKGSISPIQAFINALSASLGNGGLAGMAVGLVSGGPGTVFWVFVLGGISMVLRFSEVYAASVFYDSKDKLQGPLVYIKKLPFGSFWIYLYSIIMLVYIFSAGISMQTNSIGLSLQKTFNLSPNIIGIMFALLMSYILLGGSRRIMKLSEYIIPIKVAFFFIGVIILIIYHIDKLGIAIRLIIDSAFTLKAASGGMVAYTMQKAMISGFSKALNATEAGLGTASIFFGATEGKTPLKMSIMSMITAFISTNLVCAMLIFSVILTGINMEGLTSTKLVIAAFETVFGAFAAPAITFLTLSFGIGVMVAYTFLGFKMWDFIFGNNFRWVYMVLLPLLAYLGSVATVGLIWKSVDLLAGLLILINVSAVLWSLPELIKNFKRDRKNI